MVDSLELGNTQVLIELHHVLSRFREEVGNDLRMVETEIDFSREWLNNRIDHWQREVNRANRELTRAKLNLDRCETSGYYDKNGHYHYPDCSYELEALRQAQYYLKSCQENLKNAKTWQSHVNKAIEDYNRISPRLKNLIGEHTEKAQSRLVNLKSKYEVVKEAALRIPVGDFGLQSTPTNRSPRSSLDNSEFVDQSHTRTNRWKTNFKYININDLPDPEGINSESNFKKISAEEMKKGLLLLQEMIPTIKSGEGSNGDYWSNRDSIEGHDYQDGFRCIYDSFYGLDAIRVTFNNGRYMIINGRHRIWLAKRMGVDYLPVKLVEIISEDKN